MRRFIHVLLITAVLLAGDNAEGREWVSRDGRFTVEAELLTVDAGQVVLRREGGSVIRVPLERLSLGDAKYVREALEAAGLAVPAGSAAPTDEPAATEMEPPASKPQTPPVPDGPPLAQQGLARWQAAPDPAPQGFDLKPDAVVEISVESRFSRPFVLYPSSPSPFVLLAGDENNGPRQLWDLREEKAVGTIDVEVDRHDDLALSPDGRHLAYHNHSTRGVVRVWSFSAGEFVKSLQLPEQHSQVRFLDFAGAERIVVGESTENMYLIYDVESGRQCGAIPARPAFNDTGHVLSPGGNYLVVYPGSNKPMVIYDTRNGVRAGILETEFDTFMTPLSLNFSPDGSEFAAFLPKGAGILIQVWNLNDGSTAVTHHLMENPNRSLGFVRYHGRLLEWLGDHSGWLLSGVAVLDRQSGKIVWQDRKAIGANEVLPRRIVDADRMLSFRKGAKEQTLCLVSLPKDEIAKSREIVTAGGTAGDAGLPSTTQPLMQEVEEITLASTSWTYRPAVPTLPPKAVLRNSLRLGNGSFDHGRAFFSRPDAARVAIGRRVEDSEAAWKALSPLPQACHLYDLQTGEQVAQFDVPFPAEFVDLSPDGKLGLFRIDRSKDRLDIWDLASGQHVLAFRPFDEPGSRDRQVDWAGFADENHVISVSGTGRLVAWKLPECRAVYKSRRPYCRIAGMTRDRQTMVVMSGNTPHFVDPLSGRTVGTLPEIETEGSVVLPHASFSPDENRLAVLSTLDDGCLLAVWDLNDRSLLMKSEFPFDVYGLVWCGPGHVLLNRSAGSDDPDTLIDVERGLVVWNYATERGSFIRSSPDQRCWFYCRNRAGTPRELAAFELPDEEVESLLSRVQQPAPLIGPNANVAVQTQVENPPQAIPPGWGNLESLEEGLRQHFSKELQGKRVNVVAGGNVRLVVGIDQKKLEETMSVDRLFGPSEKLLISATLLIPYVAVVDSSGKRIWSRLPKERDLERVDLDDCPEGMDKETYMKLQQWENAVQWLRSVEIPCPLFHPSVHRGFGESVVTPEKMQILRSPSPAQVKPRGKTAKVPSVGAAQSS